MKNFSQSCHTRVHGPHSHGRERRTWNPTAPGQRAVKSRGSWLDISPAQDRSLISMTATMVTE